MPRRQGLRHGPCWLSLIGLQGHSAGGRTPARLFLARPLPVGEPCSGVAA